MNDGSFHGLLPVACSFREDLNLIAGFQLSIGRHGTEFGRILATGRGAPYYEAPAIAYIQWLEIEKNLMHALKTYTDFDTFPEQIRLVVVEEAKIKLENHDE